MYLYELGTRPWEVRTEEERKRIERYELIVQAVAANTAKQEALRKLQKS